MNFLSGLIPSESMMKWREPNAYVRKSLSHGRWIGLAIVFMIPCLLIFEPHHLYLGSLFIGLGIFGFIVTWFGSGSPVSLKEDHISKLAGRSANRSRYKDIECCSVSHDSYNDTKFSVLKFTMKKAPNFFSALPTGQIKEVAVPDDVNLEQVLQFLRDKGVKVIEAPLPS